MLRSMPVGYSRRRFVSLLALVGGPLLLGACGSSSSSSSTPVAVQRLPSGASAGQARGGRCAAARAPAPRGAQRIPRPTRTLDPHRLYLVRLSTNCGTIDIQLAVRAAPRTTASFAYLVDRGFYNGLTFHRVARGFVIQGGDPNGDGSGGPGYSVVEPPPSATQYTRGTVAMAKTSTDPPGTSGSQFFIVTAARAPLPPEYALVGNVVGGMAGVEAINRLPTDPPQDGAPTRPVVIGTASLRTS